MTVTVTSTAASPVASPDAASPDAASVVTRIRDYALGPTRFMTLYSCHELGILDFLRASPDSGYTAGQIAAAVGVPESAVEQLLHLMVKDDFVSLDSATGRYTAGSIACLSGDEYARVFRLMTMIKVVCLRQLYYLSDSVRTGTVAGLKELYGFDGTLYEACVRYPDLNAAWSVHMDQTTSLIDPWFFANVDIAAGSKVLDLAGHTGLGAILTYQHNRARNLRVTCFDFPEKEAEALANFRAHGVDGHCDYVAGDVFEGLPEGYDTVLIKHFLDQFGRENVLRILRAVNACLKPGGEVFALVPTYPEDVKASSQADFFPAYFLGCSMGEGGPQKVSTYRQWMESCGFRVTQTITHDTSEKPPEMIHVHSILRGEKVC
jgi:2-polyprenyl-3-methyl-5-hydroxy-6-metoxy-1,4-benzoquinol methylase